MTLKNTDRLEDVECALGAAVRGLLARNAGLTPANILTELTIRSFSQNTEEAVRSSAAIAWFRNCTN